MLIKSVVIDGKTKLIQIDSMTFEEFILDKYKLGEKDFREALKQSGFKPQLIDKELEKLKKDYKKFCIEYELPIKF
ncbi:hypothetical protein [Clostridium cylindrosporum]|uniref:Uncharacterized protein n=1 Tax=Clostridium cylindrosporum DSM 605 TaxID=1121307 RepID=A0A0J8G021_CLOCY|nr:hypothetical protein [Clostridium cylindrosporum]KMT21146.1 hypothetical protein CLCY_1c03800 [Clostridium cylindrosporum DSM 605]